MRLGVCSLVIRFFSSGALFPTCEISRVREGVLGSSWFWVLAKPKN